MAATGAYSFRPSLGEVVIAAYRRLQMRPAELFDLHLSDAVREANLLQVEWANKGPNLWGVEQIVLALTAGKVKYSVPANTIEITDAYISSVAYSSATGNFESESFSTDFDVEDYESRGDPVASVAPTIRDLTISKFSRTDYAELANKFVTGRPTSYWHDKEAAQEVRFWPAPDKAYTVILFRFRHQQDAALGAGAHPDVPYQMHDAYVAGLAHRLSRIYKPEMEPVRKIDAMEAWLAATPTNTEPGPLRVRPRMESYYR